MGFIRVLANILVGKKKKMIYVGFLVVLFPVNKKLPQPTTGVKQSS